MNFKKFTKKQFMERVNKDLKCLILNKSYFNFIIFLLELTWEAGRNFGVREFRDLNK